MPLFLPVSSTRFYNGGRNVTPFKISSERHNNNNTLLSVVSLNPFLFYIPDSRNQSVHERKLSIGLVAQCVSRLHSNLNYVTKGSLQSFPTYLGISWFKGVMQKLLREGRGAFLPTTNTRERLCQDNSIAANQSYQCIIINNNNINEGGTLQHSRDPFSHSCTQLWSKSRSLKGSRVVGSEYDTMWADSKFGSRGGQHRCVAGEPVREQIRSSWPPRWCKQPHCCCCCCCDLGTADRYAGARCKREARWWEGSNPVPAPSPLSLPPRQPQISLSLSRHDGGALKFEKRDGW